jgi:hypothetical protein
MPSYRAYRLDSRHHIRNAEWVEAENDAQALSMAEDLCDPETPTVELWQATRKIEEIDCEEVEEKAG